MIKKVEQDRQKCLFASVTMFKLYDSGPSEPEGPGARGTGTPNFIPKEAKSSFYLHYYWPLKIFGLTPPDFWTKPTRFLDWPHQLFGPSAGPELVLLMLSTSKLNHQSDLECCHLRISELSLGFDLIWWLNLLKFGVWKRV